MPGKNMDDKTFKILYENLCQGVSQEKLAEKYKNDVRFNHQRKISDCVIEHGFGTGVAGFQARQSRKHLIGISCEEFRNYIEGYQGNSNTNLDDFLTHVEKSHSIRQQTAANQKPVQQNTQQQSRGNTLQKEAKPQYSNPVPIATPSQLTIGELCRLSPWELTPQQLSTLKAAGYVYEQPIGWITPEDIAESNALSEYNSKIEAKRKAEAEHDAKMAAAGYLKVGNEFDGYQWISQEQAQINTAAALAMEKGRLAEYVITQVQAGNLEFYVALLGYNPLGSRPEHTVSFSEIISEKHKHLTFLPEKKRNVLKTYPSFHLLQTVMNGDDITNVNSIYLIPRGYRITKISMCGKLQDRPDLPDAMMLKLTCEDLRNINTSGI
jgi:hypothetical protein